MARATDRSTSATPAAISGSNTSAPSPTRQRPTARACPRESGGRALHPDRAQGMGLCPGLPYLAATRRGAALLAAPIQLASPARRDKITNAHQPPRPLRGQPVEAPQLA